MRLVLGAVGRLKAGPERDLFERYHTRARALARSAGLTGLDLVDVEEGRGRSADERKREEAVALGTKLAGDTRLLLFDERGVGLTSEAFAGLISRTRDAGHAVLAVVVGGPDGFEDAFRSRAHTTMSFGAATLPHQLVRVLAAEQVYRAFTILTGHPYHRV